MKKGWIIGIIVALLIIGSGAYYFFKSSPPFCGDLFYINDVKTGECKIYVSCSLPSNMKENLSCKSILEKQIDPGIPPLPPMPPFPRDLNNSSNRPH